MKKAIAFLFAITLATGCSCEATLTKDTPTKKVEQFFNNYQTLNSDVLSQLDNVIEKEATFTDDQKDEYRDIMKKHYQDLKYEIKDESIDGDNATVKVEIEVKDYSTIMKDADTYLEAHPEEFADEAGTYDVTLFNKYRLEKIKEANEKVKYTLDLTLTKVDDEWKLDDINQVDESKIHGTYQH